MYEVKQDYNGLWFVLNDNGFPISNAYASEKEAQAFAELMKEI